MKPLAIGGPVIEPAQPAEGVIAVIVEPGVFRDFLAQPDEFVEHFLELVRFLQAAAGHEFPGFPPQCPVRFLQIAAHLHQGLFLPAKLHGQRTAQFLILLAQLRLFGFQRHILRTEQLHLVLRVAIQNQKPPRRQFPPQRMRDINAGEFELSRLELRLDVFDKVQIGLFRVRAVRVTGHGDVTLRRFLVQRGAQLAPIQQPALEIRDGPALCRALLQSIEQWFDLIPVAQVDFPGQKPSRLVRRQSVKRQQLHSGRIMGRRERGNARWNGGCDWV